MSKKNKNQLSLKTKIIIVMTIFSVIAVLIAQKSFTASTSGTATATILAAISVTENTAMAFGNIGTDATAQTVTLSAAGSITCPSGYGCSGSPSQGIFDITGPDQSLNVTYSNGTLSDGSGNTMALNVATPTTPNASTITPSSGTATLNVGGELSVGTSQVAGSYSTANAGGSAYTVTVNY